MACTGMRAGDEGVEPLDLVDEPVHHQEIQCTVSHRRLRAEAGIAQPVQQFVCAQGPMFTQKDLKRRAAHGGEAQPLGGAMRLGRGDGGFDTRMVIVLVEPDRTRRLFACLRLIRRRTTCHVISFPLMGL